MAEVTAPGTTTALATTVAPEVKLSPTEQVYKDFNIEETASQFQPETTKAPQTTQTTQAPVAPKFDPFDPNFSAHLGSMANGVTSLNQALQATRTELGSLRQELHHERTEADIKRAVGTIAEKSGLDQKFTEVAFQLRAKEDPRLLSIWNNRSKNPKALEKALEAVATEFKETYTVRQDPQLVENQRAVKASQQSLATTTRTSQNDQWASMTPAERQAERNRIMRAG